MILSPSPAIPCRSKKEFPILSVSSKGFDTLQARHPFFPMPVRNHCPEGGLPSAPTGAPEEATLLTPGGETKIVNFTPPMLTHGD